MLPIYTGFRTRPGGLATTILSIRGHIGLEIFEPKLIRSENAGVTRV